VALLTKKPTVIITRDAKLIPNTVWLNNELRAKAKAVFT
jgi:hypothetical protein